MDRMIAKVINKKGYDSCCIKTTSFKSGSTISGNYLLQEFNATPFHIFSRLGSSSGTQNTNALIPFDLIQAQGYNQFLRYANMYKEFKIKAIRFEFVPSNAVTGTESTLPGYAGAPIAAPSGDLATMYNANTNASAMYWCIRWPDKDGSFQSVGLNFASLTTTNANISSNSLLNDPKTIKIPMTEKFVLFWKPKIMGTKVRNWAPLNFSASTNPVVTTFAKSYAMRFPWTDILDNVESGHTVANNDWNTGQVPIVNNGLTYNTTGLRQPMTQPWIALYNSLTGTFVSDPAPYIVGQESMHVLFEFKTKRPQTASVSSTILTELGTIDRFLAAPNAT